MEASHHEIWKLRENCTCNPLMHKKKESTTPPSHQNWLKFLVKFPWFLWSFPEVFSSNFWPQKFRSPNIYTLRHGKLAPVSEGSYGRFFSQKITNIFSYLNLVNKRVDTDLKNIWLLSLWPGDHLVWTIRRECWAKEKAISSAIILNSATHEHGIKR